MLETDFKMILILEAAYFAGIEKERGVEERGRPDCQQRKSRVVKNRLGRNTSDPRRSKRREVFAQRPFLLHHSPGPIWGELRWASMRELPLFARLRNPLKRFSENLAASNLPNDMYTSDEIW